MRYQGRLSEWKDDRGFGFIAPNGGGPKVFLHISEFSERSGRPTVGLLVTYQLGSASNGRIRAKNVRMVSTPHRVRARQREFLLPALAVGVGVVVVAGVGWVWISHPNSTIAASGYKILFAREALRSNPQFACAPEKSSCSAMRSCAEAFFHQERCGVQNMDGNRDGIPCERQWCN